LPNHVNDVKQRPILGQSDCCFAGFILRAGIERLDKGIKKDFASLLEADSVFKEIGACLFRMKRWPPYVKCTSISLNNVYKMYIRVSNDSAPEGMPAFWGTKPTSPNRYTRIEYPAPRQNSLVALLARSLSRPILSLERRKML